MRRRRATAGSSLVEVLSAISLFAVVASGVSAIATGSFRRTADNRHATAAAMLAQQQVEELRGLPYAAVQTGTTSAIVGERAYEVHTAVAPNTPAAGMKQIRVTVSWTGPTGPRAYAIETIYTAITS